MYDVDGNGKLTREEMLQIMESYYKLVGPLIAFSGRKYEQPEQLVDEFFEQMDKVYLNRKILQCDNMSCA
jgi:Ca2+-binding EF-hand superfamily protein